eukprot:9589685-Karenia_brevis.AAC.1
MSSTSARLELLGAQLKNVHETANQVGYADGTISEVIGRSARTAEGALQSELAAVATELVETKGKVDEYHDDDVDVLTLRKRAKREAAWSRRAANDDCAMNLA